ncbi:MAG TPA: hypothetical protein VER14_03995, partial [Phototrophicaceae bacterium]|nr:hypothetical protein [Phototrophicaceae bacterium]
MQLGAIVVITQKNTQKTTTNGKKILTLNLVDEKKQQASIPVVSIIMGSDSDLDIMKEASQ